MTCKEQEFKLRVVGGLDSYEVSDAFIKGLENHQTYESCFWAFVLLQSGYYKHIWKHLAIYASQLSNNRIIEISALRNCFDLNTTAKDRKTEAGFCYICRAINGLCDTKNTTIDLTNSIIEKYCKGDWRDTFPSQFTKNRV